MSQPTAHPRTSTVSNAAFYNALESALGHPLPRTSEQPDTQPVTVHPSLTIVIPALNEEEAIAGTLTSVLNARAAIIAQTPIRHIEVVVVNDGSTDRTQEIAESFSEVRVIRFVKNRGYGAALKAGFQANRSDIVSFIDADGTLRAESFIPMLNKLFDEQADVVLGARLNPESEMPAIRRLGNWGFARLLGFISGQPLTDCASGMRVIRRSSLKYLMPLPDGLHFTPAMSCIALLDRRLKIGEVPVPYAERVGRSKLSVVRDGLRFLSIILLTGCFYNPIKCAATGLAITWLLGALAMFSAWNPSAIGWTVAVMSYVAVGVALIGHQVVKALIVAAPPSSKTEQLLHRWTHPRTLANFGLLQLAGCALFSGILWAVGADSFNAYGWLSMITFLLGFGTILLAVSLRMIQLIRVKLEALLDDPFTRTHASQ
ncbi:MAG: Undecaprenyl-phosphate 4-deoxy-4-formamido-L-arabinose transferase [Phycisphaerae bacterium]|nr:Undecaprenyl-phosphate 4-deoxy-4-formamido-L-arabinose transferase [Phycisphaerae bacterium]